MKAIIASEAGGPEVLERVERPVPEPSPDEVLIRVRAAGVNRPDIMQRRGLYHAPPGVTDILGLEVAGDVVALGHGVSRWSIGQRVAALVAGGGYAEYCLAFADHCLPIPTGVSDEHAAGLPEATHTVWHNLFELGKLSIGESVLLHGGASGIGTTAIQLAAAAGCRVITTVGSEAKIELVQSLGANAVVLYRQDDFVEAALRFTGDCGVDVVLDIVGGSYIARNIAALAPGGRLVSLSFLEGSTISLDLRTIMAKSIMLTGSSLRPKSRNEKARLTAKVEKHVWPLVRKGALSPHVHAVLPLEDAAEAHRIIEESSHVGKIILRP